MTQETTTQPESAALEFLAQFQTLRDDLAALIASIEAPPVDPTTALSAAGVDLDRLAVAHVAILAHSILSTGTLPDDRHVLDAVLIAAGRSAARAGRRLHTSDGCRLAGPVLRSFCRWGGHPMTDDLLSEDEALAAAILDDELPPDKLQAAVAAWLDRCTAIESYLQRTRRDARRQFDSGQGRSPAMGGGIFPTGRSLASKGVHTIGQLLDRRAGDFLRSSKGWATFQDGLRDHLATCRLENWTRSWRGFLTSRSVRWPVRPRPRVPHSRLSIHRSHALGVPPRRNSST